MKLFFTVFLVISTLLSVQSQDVFEIKFTAGVTQYRCALVIFEDGTGVMRVRYYEDGTKLIQQSMKAENTQYGIRLTGYNPIYVNTRKKNPTYSADNFYFSIDEYGNYNMVNIDDAGVSAQVFIRKIEGKYTINNFLSDFSWKL